jgi:putative component of toxin-antitoxin plasmid stabilization module
VGEVCRAGVGFFGEVCLVEDGVSEMREVETGSLLV